MVNTHIHSVFIDCTETTHKRTQILDIEYVPKILMSQTRGDKRKNQIKVELIK